MRRRTMLVALLATVALGGCLPAPATSQAHAVSDLWTVFMVAAAGVGILVWGLITWSIVRYRHRGASIEDLPPQTEDAPRLEIVWTVGPIILVLILFVFTLGALGRIDAQEPSNVTVAVTGFRWQWRFDYPGTGVSVVGGPGTTPEMVVPVGEPIHVTLESHDVIHSFYVPEFLFKRDAIPGHPTDFEFNVDQPGIYRGQCAEFCGALHYQMELAVRAVTRPEYDAWLAGQEAAASHAPSSTPTGPSLAPTSLSEVQP